MILYIFIINDMRYYEFFYFVLFGSYIATIVYIYYYKISYLLNYSHYISYFYIINRKIDKDLEIYIQCEKKKLNLICGRNKTKYKTPVIKYESHNTYISYSLIKLCNRYKTIYCSNANILIGILTRPELIYERMIMRRLLKNDSNIKYIFITGFSIYSDIVYILNHEMEIYKDILMFNIKSSYYNCSAIMACFYIYIFNNCKEVKWIMKLDIDTYVNIPMILNFIKHIKPNISVIGSMNVKPKLKCNSNSKWSINCYNESNLYITIPSYPFGPAFLFDTFSLVCINSYFSKTKKIIWIEDVLFGEIMHYCKLKYLDISYITEITYKPKTNLSDLTNKVFIHGLNPIEMLLYKYYK